MDLLIFDSIEVDFQTEEDCENYLVKRRWSMGFFCPGCDHDSFYKVKTRKLLECKECRAQTSITAGTVMHKSKLSLLIWFKAIRILIQNENTYTISSFANLLGVNYRTAKLLLEKLQIALKKQYGRKSSTEETKSTQNTPSRKYIFNQFLFKSLKNVKYSMSTILKKWMDAFLSVRLYPLFLRRFQI